jgi:hypothetical protein
VFIVTVYVTLLPGVTLCWFGDIDNEKSNACCGGGDGGPEAPTVKVILA